MSLSHRSMLFLFHAIMYSYGVFTTILMVYMCTPFDQLEVTKILRDVYFTPLGVSIILTFFVIDIIR